MKKSRVPFLSGRLIPPPADSAHRGSSRAECIGIMSTDLHNAPFAREAMRETEFSAAPRRDDMDFLNMLIPFSHGGPPGNGRVISEKGASLSSLTRHCSICPKRTISEYFWILTEKLESERNRPAFDSEWRNRVVVHPCHLPNLSFVINARSSSRKGRAFIIFAPISRKKRGRNLGA